MVESTQSGQLDQKLAIEWTKLAKAQESTSTFIQQSMQRAIHTNTDATDMGFFAFFNQKLVKIHWCNIIIGYQ